MRKLGVRSVVVLAILAMFGGTLGVMPSYGAPGGGATVTSVSECQESETSTTCYNERVVFKTTETGSGNLLLSGNASFLMTLTYAGGMRCSQKNAASTHYHSLIRNDPNNPQ